MDKSIVFKTSVILLTATLCGLTSAAHAECKSLVPTLSDSRHFQVGNLPSVRLTEEKVSLAIREVEKQLDCSEDSIELTSNDCDDSREEFIGSPICRAESDAGYFILIEDMVGNINLLFNRWD